VFGTGFIHLERDQRGFAALMARRFFSLSSLLLASGLLALASCGGGGDKELIIGATTSVQDPGLLDEIVREFEEITDYDVKPIVGGSGQILEMARQGEFDVIMTHSPADENKFLADDEGLDRRPAMRNFFLVAGPEGDRAGVATATTMSEAFERIAAGGHAFISRGDNSGTHRREQSIWEELGIQPDGHSWYEVSSTGQGQSLLVAADKEAYTLVDSATFTAFRERANLTALFTDREQPNIYSVIRINPEKHDVNAAGAIAFAEFITSQAGQCLIGGFGVEDYGEPLFEPFFGCPTANTG
jgi:tungstate transport system substrate-binding protein